MKKYIVWAAGILFVLACNLGTQIPYVPDKVPALLSTLETNPAATASTSTPVMNVVSPTFSPIPTFTISPTPTQELIRQGPDAITLPILLYHHIKAPKYSSYYYVPPENFAEQMKLLHDWGYMTVTLDLLVKSIKEGTDLPARPILITFDDGQTSVYDAAFPIMRQYGFTGVVYAVGKYVDAETFMTTDQLKELTAAGWEIGSHGMRHKDLTTLDPDEQRYEIFESRKILNEKLGVPINSFAYPWGGANDTAFTYVHNAGYTSAMGLGYSYNQGIWNIFLLQRRDVLASYDLKKFASFLPWYGDTSFLPTDTPTPTPTITRTPRPTKRP